MGASRIWPTSEKRGFGRAALAVAVAASISALPVLSGCVSDGADQQTSQQMEQEQKQADQATIQQLNDQRAQAANTPEAKQQVSQATEWLDGSFEALSTDGGETAKLWLSMVSFDPMDFGISWKAFSQVYYDGFSWEVVDAQGDGQGRVTVDVKLHVKQMASGIKVMRQAMDDAAAQGADISSSGYADDAFRNAAADFDWPQDELTVPVTCTLSDGVWLVENNDVLAAALLDGYDPRQAS